MSDLLSSVSATSDDGAKRRRIDANAAGDPKSDDTGSPSSSTSDGDEQQQAAGQPLLPAEVLAQVLDYMLYGDVRKSLLAGRIMAFDAATKVSVLNITLAEQLNVHAAKNRFPNVEEVNVFSLDRLKSIDRSKSKKDWVLSLETVTSVVFFLQSFPALKRTFIGGARSNNGPFWKHIENMYNAKLEYAQNQEDMRGLVLSFCGAFRNDLLPQKLAVGGILEPDSSAATYVCRRTFEKCHLCQQVCETFPLDRIADLLFWQDYRTYSYCFTRSKEAAVDIISRRQGGLEFISSERFLESFLRQGEIERYGNIRRTRHNILEEIYLERRLVSKNYSEHVYTMKAESLTMIENIANKYGLRWKFSKEIFTAIMSRAFRFYFGESRIPWVHRNIRQLFDKETHDALSSVGVAIDPEKFVVVGSTQDVKRLSLTE